MQIWLTLNDDVTHDDGSASFAASRVPGFALNSHAVNSLITALAWSPAVSPRTWVLSFQVGQNSRSASHYLHFVTKSYTFNCSFQVLCLVLNQKIQNSGNGGSAVGAADAVEQSVSRLLLTHSSFVDVLLKFLTGSASRNTLPQVCSLGLLKQRT